METFVTIGTMKQRLTKDRIAGVCRDLLQRQRRVGVRDVMRQLHQRYGVKGRTERIAAILKEEARFALPSPSTTTPDVDALLERVRVAEERAEQAEVRAVRAEELERSHQDFWATRYAERVEELERRYADQGRPISGVSADQYLKVCQLNAELARRLELYELERRAQTGEGS